MSKLHIESYLDILTIGYLNIYDSCLGTECFKSFVIQCPQTSVHLTLSKSNALNVLSFKRKLPLLEGFHLFRFSPATLAWYAFSMNCLMLICFLKYVEAMFCTNSV